MFPFSWNARPWTTPKATTTMDPGIPSLLNPMASAGLPLPGIGGFLSGCDPTVQHRANQVQQQAQPQAQNNRTLFWVNNCSTCLFSQLHLIHTSTRLRQIHLYLYLHSQLLWKIHLQLLHLQRLMDCSEMLNRIQEGLKQEINKAMMSSRPLIVQNPNLPLPNQLLPCNHHRSQLQRPDPTHLFNMPFQVLHIALLSHADLPINPAMSLVVSLPGPGSLCNIHQSLTSTQCQDVAALVGSRPAGPSAFQAPSTICLSSSSSFIEIPILSPSKPTTFAPSVRVSSTLSGKFLSTCTSSCSSTYWETHYSLLTSTFKTPSQIQISPTLPTLASRSTNTTLETPSWHGKCIFPDPLQMSHACHRFWKCYKTLTFCSLLTRCTIPCPCHAKRHLNLQKWGEHVVFCTFWLRNLLRATTAYTFSTSQLPKVVRTWCVLYILTWTCASRHNGMHFFDIVTSKSGPNPWFFFNILTF